MANKTTQRPNPVLTPRGRNLTGTRSYARRMSRRLSEAVFKPSPGERVAEGRVRGRGFHAVAGEKPRTSPHPQPLSPRRGEFSNSFSEETWSLTRCKFAFSSRLAIVIRIIREFTAVIIRIIREFTAVITPKFIPIPGVLRRGGQGVTANRDDGISLHCGGATTSLPQPRCVNHGNNRLLGAGAPATTRFRRAVESGLLISKAASSRRSGSA